MSHLNNFEKYLVGLIWAVGIFIGYLRFVTTFHTNMKMQYSKKKQFCNWMANSLGTANPNVWFEFECCWRYTLLHPMIEKIP